MTKELMEADRAWLMSLGFDEDLVDSPSGTRIIGVMFADGTKDDPWVDEPAAVIRDFACTA